MKPTNRPLLRYNQRQLLKEEKMKAERLFKDPMNDDRAAQTRTIRNVDKMLKEQGPEPLTGAEKDQLYKREKELAADIRGFMVPREEMRRTPTQQTNAVYNHLKNEGHPENKRKVVEWKNIRVQLNQDSDDPNLANADFHLRPEKGAKGHSGFMVDAMGPRGHMGFQDVPQENWDMALGEPKADTALKQAQRVHAEQKKGGMSEEARRASSERMKARWEAKRAKGATAAKNEAVAV